MKLSDNVGTADREKHIFSQETSDSFCEKEFCQNSRTEHTAWERVQISRKLERPSGSSYIKSLFTDFMELHGDRKYGEMCIRDSGSGEERGSHKRTFGETGKLFGSLGAEHESNDRAGN